MSDGVFAFESVEETVEVADEDTFLEDKSQENPERGDKGW